VKSLLFFAFSLSISTVIFSQTTNPATPKPMWMDGAFTGHDFRYEGFRGSPLFINEWIKGEINLTDGRVFTDVPLKYNAYTKGLFMQSPAGDSIAVFSNLVASFIIKDPVTKNDFTFKQYPLAQIQGKSAEGLYFLVLLEGSTTLLKLIHKIIKKADYKEPYSNNISYDTYEDTNEYYLLKNDGKLAKVKRNKKSVMEALTDKESSLQEFVTAQKLTFKTDADFVRIVSKYNTLP
jgi:hypothetical protein